MSSSSSRVGGCQEGLLCPLTPSSPLPSSTCRRAELVRLATARRMGSFFDTALLGPRGFFVPVDATDARLPGGVLVVSGGRGENGASLYHQRGKGQCIHLTAFAPPPASAALGPPVPQQLSPQRTRVGR